MIDFRSHPQGTLAQGTPTRSRFACAMRRRLAGVLALALLAWSGAFSPPVGSEVLLTDAEGGRFVGYGTVTESGLQIELSDDIRELRVVLVTPDGTSRPYGGHWNGETLTLTDTSGSEVNVADALAEDGRLLSLAWPDGRSQVVMPGAASEQASDTPAEDASPGEDAADAGADPPGGGDDQPGRSADAPGRSDDPDDRDTPARPDRADGEEPDSQDDDAQDDDGQDDDGQDDGRPDLPDPDLPDAAPDVPSPGGPERDDDRADQDGRDADEGDAQDEDGDDGVEADVEVGVGSEDEEPGDDETADEEGDSDGESEPEDDDESDEDEGDEDEDGSSGSVDLNLP